MRNLSKEIFFEKTLSLTGRLVIISVLSLPVVLFYNSLPILYENSLTDLLFSDWDPGNRVYGIRSFVYTSILTAFISASAAFLISVSAALFLYFRKSTFTGRMFYRCIKAMSGIPTVVYGLAGIMVIVPLIRNYTPSSSGLCLISVIIVLTVLVIPTMTMYMFNGLELVPDDIVTAGISLGADESQQFFLVLLPAVKKYFGIAFILGFSRALSDTMIALMISGNSFRFPTSLFQSARNVTSHIALLIPGEFSGIEFKAIFFSSLILILVVVLLNTLVIMWEKKK